MASKMWILLILCISKLVSGKSLTMVLDTTFSMHDDVEIIKNNIRSVLDTVTLVPHVDEFILVPFSDPDVGVPIKSTSPEEFLSTVHAVRTSGGTDCPENSLAGIIKGLEISKPESYIYLFTDAFANDYNLSSEVKDLCKTTKSKVIIFLSGYCRSIEGTVEIYKNITDHCSGAVFQLDRSNFKKAFQLMKEITLTEWNSIQNYYPVTDRYEIEISLDAFTSNMMIVATGQNTLVTVNDCFDCEEVMKDAKSFHVLRVKQHVGTHRLTLRCEICSSLIIYKRLDLQFQFGFSTRRVHNIKETTLKPIPGLENYITIFLKNEGSVTASSMALQSDGSPVSELHLEQLAPGCYYATAYISSDKRYRIVIKGYDSSTSQQLTGLTNILRPQEKGFVPASLAPMVEIVKPENTLIEFGYSLEIACRVTGYPKPDIWWEDSNEKKLKSDELLLETPSVYMSYATYNVTSNSTIFCKSKNFDGNASQELKLNVNKTAILEFVQKPKDETFQYGKEGKIYCQVNSYPEASITWYHNDTLLENSDNIQIKPGDNAVVIQNMGLDDVGEYKCEVSNTVEKKTVTASIDISGLEYPEIATDNFQIAVKLGERANIQCSIVKGNPVPDVTWQYKSEDSDEFGKLPTGAYVIDSKPAKNKNETLSVASSSNFLSFFSGPSKPKDNAKPLSISTNKAGIYQCKGSNILGEHSKEIILKVQVPPKIRNSEDETVTVKKGRRVELPCEVDADPDANVRWEVHHGDRIVNLSARHHVDYKNTLIFNTRWNDSGEYHCIAKNEYGSADKKYTVTVLVAPYIEAPKSKTITTTVGSTVTLVCDAFGSPSPSTRWQFSAPDSPPVTLSSGNSMNVLTLNHLTKLQEGYYSCIAENSVGVDIIKILVNVHNL
ncbi:hemicentin-1 [Amyelois transitella]|uniref:hemicentin-1 n=1 Tax=Amyelois transitella TaxID=680683 RepID=UPI00067E24F3|nr:hemicentin-1 [Amyelois transitella]